MQRICGDDQICTGAGTGGAGDSLYKLACGAESLVRLFGQRSQYCAFHPGCYPGVPLRERWRRFVDQGMERLIGSGPGKGSLSDQHLVNDDPKRVHVSPGVQLSSHGLLGRHVPERAHGGALARDLASPPGLDQAEIGQGHLVGGANDDVGRFYVAVHQSLLVGIIERARQLSHDTQNPGERQLPGLLDLTLQGLAVQVFHDDVLELLVRANVKDDYNIRVPEVGSRDRLAAKALRELFVGSQHWEQDL